MLGMIEKESGAEKNIFLPNSTIVQI